MSEITALTRRMEAVEKQNADQTGKLDEAVDLLRRIETALTGDSALGITGLAAGVRSAHDRIDVELEARASFEEATRTRMREIEEAAAKEKWMGRIGSGVVGTAVAAVGIWLKRTFFGEN